ncbi:MAG: hypothetical protein HPY55_05875 [Firmicutes bacterium]|nr:hypothetical protein [Bacillota bacterium]
MDSTGPIVIIEVPYHLGRKSVGVGAGPARFIEAGVEGVVAGAVVESGREARLRRWDSDVTFRHEIGTAMEVVTMLSAIVRDTVASGGFPLVLAGNCNSCLGVLAGAGNGDTGIVWFDAHADFNTPDTTLSGYFDGMPLSAATGLSWRSLVRRVPGFRPVSAQDVVLAGVREIDKGEERFLVGSGVTVVSAEQIARDGIADALVPTLDGLSTRVRNVYLHIDIDVTGAGKAAANEFTRAGWGLPAETVAEACRHVASRFRLVGAALTGYNPDFDETGDTLAAGLHIAGAVAGAAALVSPQERAAPGVLPGEAARGRSVEQPDDGVADHPEAR